MGLTKAAYTPCALSTSCNVIATFRCPVPMSFHLDPIPGSDRQFSHFPSRDLILFDTKSTWF